MSKRWTHDRDREICHAEKLGGQIHVVRAVQLFAAEMIQDGEHPGDQFVATADDQVLWVEAYDEVQAVMCFQGHIDYAGYVWVSFSYVKPSCRRQGLHRALNARLEKLAKELGAKYVARSVMTHNDAMHAAMKSYKYQSVRLVYERMLP